MAPIFSLLRGCAAVFATFRTGVFAEDSAEPCDATGSCSSASLSEADLDRARKALPNIDFKDFGYGVADFITRKNVEHFQANLEPDDIIIASYPKSGTNWVKQIVHATRLGGDMKLIEKHSQTDLSFLINIPEAIPNFDFKAVSEIRPRAFFSHMQYQDVPKGARIIYVLRDIHGALPSYYKYVKHFAGNFENHTVVDVAQLMMDGLLYSGSWEDHVAGYWAKRSDPNVLIVKYEDMKKDLTREVLRISKFLGTKLTKEGLQTAVKVSSLDYMKKNSDKIQGKDWAEEVTGQKVSDAYKLVDGNRHDDVMTKGISEALTRHFKEKAAPKLGGASKYADIVVE